MIEWDFFIGLLLPLAHSLLVAVHGEQVLHGQEVRPSLLPFGQGLSGVQQVRTEA